MPLLLLLVFIGVPLLEIAVFIQVGGLIGLGWTLALVVLTAVIGTWQLRAQGLATLARGRAQLDAGQMPTRELFDGVCLLFAGALLLTPGFVTDGFGMLLFLPPFRAALRRFFSRFVASGAETRVWVNGAEMPGSSGRPRPGPQDGVIEGEFEEVSDEPDPKSEPEPGGKKGDRRLGGGPETRP